MSEMVTRCASRLPSRTQLQPTCDWRGEKRLGSGRRLRIRLSREHGSRISSRWKALRAYRAGWMVSASRDPALDSLNRSDDQLLTMPDAHSMPHLLLVLAALLATTKLFGALAQRVGQPAVLGELLAGVLLGGSVLGLLDPGDPVIHALSELGVIVLLFEIGLHTDLRAMARVAGTATTVGVVGVILPFVLGYYAASAILGFGQIASLVCGAALTATSIGISARVLSDLGQLNTREGQVVLGAAVLDDIIGLIVLSVVTSMVLGGTWTLAGIAITRSEERRVGK